MENNQRQSRLICLRASNNFIYELKTIKEHRQHLTITEVIYQAIHKEYRRVDSEQWKLEQRQKQNDKRLCK